MQLNIFKKRYIGLLGLFLLCFFSFLASAWLIWEYVKITPHSQQEMQKKNRETLQLAATAIGIKLEHTKHLVEDLAKTFSYGVSSKTLSKADLDKRLKQKAIVNPKLYAIGVAFQPDKYEPKNEPKTRLFAPRYIRSPFDKSVEATLVRTGYGLRHVYADIDYSKEKEEYRWYHDSLESADWSEPFYDPITHELVIQYAAPIVRTNSERNNKESIGIVFIQHTLANFDKILKKFRLGENGYFFLLSKKETFLSHPHKAVIQERKTVSRLADKDACLAQIAQLGFQQEFQVECPADSIYNEQPGTYYLKPIQTAGWTLGGVYIQRDTFNPLSQLSKIKFQLSVSVIVFFISLSLLGVVVFQKYTPVWLWGEAALISTLLIAGIGIILWLATLSSPVQEEKPNILISDKPALASFYKDELKQSIDEEKSIPMFIPTGIFLQSIENTERSRLKLTGYVWQTYINGIHDGLKKGVIFPDAITVNMKPSPSYTQVEKEDMVVGWYFEIILKMDFNIAKYPFGDEIIRIQLRHQEFDKNVILVPDLDSYQITAPLSLPGIRNGLVSIGSWRLNKSYFSVRDYDYYHTAFGLRDYQGRKHSYALSFNMVMRQQLASTFISDILPLIVVSVILFVAVMLAANPETKFDGKYLVIIISVLFFGLFYNHGSLRSTLPENQIFYLEYFYFIVYAALVIMALNTLLLVSKAKSLSHQDASLTSKLIYWYWPVTMFMLYLVTVLVFY